MTKLMAAVHLDYVTVKPYFTVKNLLIYAAMALFLTAMSASISSGLGVGLMIATLFVSYPFALSEKNNLDALYTTLSVDPKTVVRGRYIFTLLLNIGAVLFALLLAWAGMFFARMTGLSAGNSGEEAVVSVLVLSALFILIQAIQLPVYFKLGYAKAKVLSILPFAILMAGFAAFSMLKNVTAGLAGFLDKLFISGAIVPLLIGVMIAAVLLSYGLSVAFYRKREF